MSSARAIVEGSVAVVIDNEPITIQYSRLQKQPPLGMSTSPRQSIYKLYIHIQDVLCFHMFCVQR